MKHPYKIIVAILAVIFFSWLFYSKQHTTPIENTSNLLQYSSSMYGISFSYPDDYVLSEQDATANDLQKYHQITLVNKKDLPLPTNGEGPTAITIDLYKNDTKKYTALSWVRNSKESNLKLGEGILATTTISGLEAISFRWSGLYEGTTIVLAKPNFVYTFNVTYMEIGAQIIQDFVKIRDSIKI